MKGPTHATTYIVGIVTAPSSLAAQVDAREIIIATGVFLVTIYIVLLKVIQS